MTHRRATNSAKNYCNRTTIVKVILENVVTCFFGDTVYRKFYIFSSVFSVKLSIDWINKFLYFFSVSSTLLYNFVVFIFHCIILCCAI